MSSSFIFPFPDLERDRSDPGGHCSCDEKRQSLIKEDEASFARPMCHDDRESDSDASQDLAKRIQEQEKPQCHEVDDRPIGDEQMTELGRAIEQVEKGEKEVTM